MSKDNLIEIINDILKELDETQLRSIWETIKNIK